MADGQAGFDGQLKLRLNGKDHPLPLSVREWLDDLGHGANHLGSWFSTELHLAHYTPHPKGKHIAGVHFGDASHPFAGQPHHLVQEHTLSGGKVLNCGVNLMANEVNNMTAATPFATIPSMNYHYIGTGTTADAQSDYWLQTPIAAASLTGSTNGAMTGTQTAPANASPNVYQTACTFTANATLAVSEWLLAFSNAAPFTGRTSTGTSATSITDTGASFTNTGNKLAGWVVEINATAINTTPTTTTMMLVNVNVSNSATVLNGAAGWVHLDNSAASTPSATSAYVVYPCAWDHKAGATDFPTINMVATDTLAPTYKLTVTAGG